MDGADQPGLVALGERVVDSVALQLTEIPIELSGAGGCIDSAILHVV